jgi:GT2 family glycosyltransferase
MRRLDPPVVVDVRHSEVSIGRVPSSCPREREHVTSPPECRPATSPISAITVVIATRNGERTLSRTLDALFEQKDAPSYDVVLVDDGSQDQTASIAEDHGVSVLSFHRNVGKCMALNVAVSLARAPILAMIDDDCVPHPYWLHDLALVWESVPENVTMLGGPIVPFATDTYNRRYVAVREPIVAQEAALNEHASLYDRFRLAIIPSRPAGRRPVFFVPGANMSARRIALLRTTGFPEVERIGEEEEIARKLRAEFGTDTVQFVPELVMRHDFHPSLRDTMRRAQWYGRTFGKKARAHERVTLRTDLLLVCGVGVLAATLGVGFGIAALLTAPLVIYRRWWRAFRGSPVEALTYPYVQLVEDVAYFRGFVDGWRAS